MKICETHWTKLKQAIADRGLGAFVTHSGEAVMAKLEAGAFEPLMGAHNMIVSNAMGTVGLDMMMHDECEACRGCPLCFLQKHCPCGEADCASRFEAWIDKAVDGQLAYAREKGLVGSS